jgi:16S rRNA C1402 N4-methylase RsmH
MAGECLMQTISAIDAAHELLKKKLQTALTIVDATAGNGNDTLFLAQNSLESAHIYAFDIQTSALDKTAEIVELYRNKVQLILDSHVNIEKYVVTRIDVAMFNLGYLPGGDHAITTQADSTMEAVTKIIDCLATNGLLAITTYPGHEEGLLEYNQLVEYLRSLPMQEFTVACYSMLNHTIKAPVLYLIEKVRR